jgi:hypothetical protein
MAARPAVALREGGSRIKQTRREKKEETTMTPQKLLMIHETRPRFYRAAGFSLSLHWAAWRFAQ